MRKIKGALLRIFYFSSRGLFPPVRTGPSGRRKGFPERLPSATALEQENAASELVTNLVPLIEAPGVDHGNNSGALHDKRTPSRVPSNLIQEAGTALTPHDIMTAVNAVINDRARATSTQNNDTFETPVKRRRVQVISPLTPIPSNHERVRKRKACRNTEIPS